MHPRINSMAEEEGAADWSNLPYGLMEEILDQLAESTLDISDYARCAAVCVSWQQVYNDHEPLISPQLPVLMIPINNTPPEDDSNQFRSFYRITDGKVVYDQFKVRMPSYMQCRGSSHGWLVTVDDDVDKGFPVRLVNPFLSSSDNNEISLPSLNHLPVLAYDSDDDEDDDGPRNCAYLHKAILSADPLSIPDNYIVMAIYGERFKKLAYWRPCDQVWVPIGPKRIQFEDVVLKTRSNEDYSYHNDEFLAVTSRGTIFSFKVGDILNENVADVFANTQTRYNRRFRFHELPHVPNKKLYLVPIFKRTAHLLVVRVIDIGDEDETTKTRPYSTKEFKVLNFRLIEEEGGKRSFAWEETKTLEGQTLFIGDNASMSISAADCPHVCKPDCIYYTDDCYLGYVKDPAGNEHGAHDMGLFNVKDNSFEKHYPTDDNNPIWPIPIWVEPSIRKAGGGVFRE